MADLTVLYGRSNYLVIPVSMLLILISVLRGHLWDKKKNGLLRQVSSK
jgi:hypothetical protein